MFQEQRKKSLPRHCLNIWGNGWSDEFAKWCLVQECEENGEKVLKELSVEEIYNYYEQANIKEKEWIKQLVFEYQIVNVKWVKPRVLIYLGFSIFPNFWIVDILRVIIQAVF